MICPKCGAVLKENAKFCTACGERVPDSQQVSTEKAPASRRWKVVIAVCLAVIAVCGIVAALWAGGVLGGSGGAVRSDAENPVTVGGVTVIIPASEDGAPIMGCVVRMVQGSSSDGSPIDVASLPELAIEGGDGFKMEEFGELDDGVYEMQVVESESGETNDLFVNYEKDAPEAPETVTMMVAPDPEQDAGEDTEALAAGAFLDVLDGLIEEYGEPAVAYDDFDSAYANGLCFTKLVDFGDGEERLLVVYCAKDWIGGPQDYDGLSENYIIEIWEYDEASDVAEMVYRGGEPDVSNGGFYFLSLFEPGDGKTFVRSWHWGDDSFQEYVGITESGEIGVVSKFSVSGEYTTSPTYYVDGNEVSSERYHELEDEFTQGDWFGSAYLLLGSSMEGALTTVEESVATVEEVRSELQARVSDA